jgi:hypothetical protein
MVGMVPLPKDIPTLVRRKTRKRKRKRKKKIMLLMSHPTWKPLPLRSTKRKKKLPVLPVVRTPKLWLRRIAISGRKRKNAED